MDEPPVLPQQACPYCGAPVAVGAAQCWLCQQAVPPIVTISESIPDIANEPGYYAAIEKICGALIAACLILAVLVSVGLAVNDPGMLIPYAVIVIPPLIAGSVSAARQMKQRGTIQPSRVLTSSLLTMAISLFASVGVIAILVVGAVLMLVVICLQSPLNFR